MPFVRSSRVVLLLGLALSLSLSGCLGLGGDDPSPVSADEPEVALLPPATAQASPPLAESALPDPDEPPAGGDTEDETLLSIEPPSSLRCLPARLRAAQLLLPLATEAELPGAQVFAASGELGGIGLLGSPGDGLVAELESLQLSSFVPIMVASDEEGGSVQRLADLLGPLPSAASDARSKSAEDVRNQWVEYGARVRALGVTVVFGPVLDVGSAPGIESRSFGDDPQVVASFGRAVADGLLEAGIMPVFKHFPGHGRATADSHLQLPTTPPLEELRQADLVPYAQILAEAAYRDRAAVMIGHLSVPGLSEEVPTSLSAETINGLLRGELGFGGLVFTDALNMGAIVNTYDPLEALELSLVAGADIAILGSLADLTPALDYLVSRVEQDPGFAAIVDNRTARVLAAKGQSEICDGAR